MDVINKNDFDKIAQEYKYYLPQRWEYMNFVCKYLSKKPNNLKVLEIGAYRLPLVKNSITMDKNKYLDNVIIHDGNNFPYPFHDKEFDICICLQTLEHFEDRKKAFKEIFRISKEAIISLPYLWQNGENNHKNINLQMINEWAQEEADEIKIIGKHKKRINLIYR